MSICDFGVGDLVEATQDAYNGLGHTIAKGRIYTCVFMCQADGCGAHCSTCRMVAIKVREAMTPGPWAWCSDFFRPVRGASEATLHALLAGDHAETAEGPVRRVPEPVATS